MSEQSKKEEPQLIVDIAGRWTLPEDQQADLDAEMAAWAKDEREKEGADPAERGARSVLHGSGLLGFPSPYYTRHRRRHEEGVGKVFPYPSMAQSVLDAIKAF